MVFEVEIHRDESMVSVPFAPQHQNTLFITVDGDVNRREMHEISCTDRDTSVTCRENVDNSRQTVNTYTSILNVTQDDDEDEEENKRDSNNDDTDDLLLFDEMSPIPLSQSFNNNDNDSDDVEPGKAVCFPDILDETPSTDYETLSSCEVGKSDASSEQTKVKDGNSFFGKLIDSSTNSLGAVTETLVENLCNPFATTSSTIGSPKNVKWTMKDSARNAIHLASQRRVLEMDLLAFLGLSEPPSNYELEEIWFVVADFLCLETCPGNFDDASMRGERLLQNGKKQDSEQPLPRFRHNISNRERARRIHRFYTERMLPGLTKNADKSVDCSINDLRLSSSSPKSVIQRVKSMDDSVMNRKRKQFANKKKESSFVMDDPFNMLPPQLLGAYDELENMIGKGLDPILPQHDLDNSKLDDDVGYDSDPGELSFHTANDSLYHSTSANDSLYQSISETSTSFATTFSASSHEREHPRQLITERMICTADDETISRIVQETLNCAWTLTYHPGPSNAQNPLGLTPQRINVWFERGSLIHNNSVMLEPSLKWTETNRNSDDRGKRKLPIKKPVSMRLMDLCRIIEASPQELLSSYPLARTSCCFFMKNCRSEEYLFEAASAVERDNILQRWKVCVARLASLAVMEDLSALEEEFFTPV